MTSDLKWSPNDLDGSNGIKKQFIAKCHVEVGAGGFLRFPIPPSRQLPWLDERLMAQFVEAELAQAVKRIENIIENHRDCEPYGCVAMILAELAQQEVNKE